MLGVPYNKYLFPESVPRHMLAPNVNGPIMSRATLLLPVSKSEDSAGSRTATSSHVDRRVRVLLCPTLPITVYFNPLYNGLHCISIRGPLVTSFKRTRWIAKQRQQQALSEASDANRLAMQSGITPSLPFHSSGLIPLPVIPSVTRLNPTMILQV